MPLIPLPIYKPIFFAGRFEPILLNKVEIQPGRVVLQLPLRGLITQIPFNPKGLLRCRSDSRSRIFKVSSRSCPFGYGQFLAKFGIFGQIGIWHFKSTLKSLQIITMSFKNKFSAIQSSVHFPNKQLLKLINLSRFYAEHCFKYPKSRNFRKTIHFYFDKEENEVGFMILVLTSWISIWMIL